jgi:tRNA(Ile2)-agmatinylcytidine synthase
LLLHVGIDDTDSPEGGCTTYIAVLLVERFEALGCRFVDYPNLLRLNPNAPWKTRGNGAVCLRVEAPMGTESEVKKAVIEVVDAHGMFGCDNTNPGAVFHVGDVPPELKIFHDEAVRTIVRKEEAERLIQEHCAAAVGWKNRRGLIGALAAIGGTLEGDHTYELLTYRTHDNLGTPRQVDGNSVRAMDAVLPRTFNNVDPDTGQVLIAPRGPDPVLYGVRGEEAEDVLRAQSLIEVGEPVERWAVFRTNQGTEAHLKDVYRISDLQPFIPSIVAGVVERKPRTIKGGHTFFSLRDGSGRVDCAAYEPSGRFREVVGALMEGDKVRVAGGVRETPAGYTVNMERLEILSLAPKARLVNPRCPSCGGPTESMGRGQGLRCKNCGYRGAELAKVAVEEPRGISPGIFLPPPRSERHLTKPLRRYGREKQYRGSPPIQGWHS